MRTWLMLLVLMLSRAPAHAQLSDAEIRQLVTNSPWSKQVPVAGSSVIVRWESASPVIEACAQGGMEKYLYSCASKLLYLSGLQKKFSEMVEHFYILSISNYPKSAVMGAGPHPPEHSPAANAELAEIGKNIRQRTTLRPGRGAPIKPIDVVVLPAGETLLVLLFFDRREPLTESGDGLAFESSYGSIHIGTRFRLTEMRENGKAAL